MAADRDDVGFLLALASKRWNEILKRRFAAAGFADVRASYGALLIPLFEEDGLRMTELARRARLSKQTLTTMARLLERDGLITRRPDSDDGRAIRIFLTERAKSFQPIADAVLRELDKQVVRALGKARTTQLKQSLDALLELDEPSLRKTRSDVTAFP